MKTLYKHNPIEIINNHASNTHVLKVRDLPTEAKPREKLLSHGPSTLSAEELMAIILTVGTKKEEVITMTTRILREYGEKTIASETNASRLCKELDIPIGKACQIVAAFELGRCFFTPGTGRSIIIRTPTQAYNHLADMAKLPKEHLRGLYLNSRYQLIHDEVISIGSLTASIIHPREVFRPALEYNASAVILAHNHPSGAQNPSADDITITKQLQKAADIIGIELLDHLIITQTGYESLIK